MDKLTTQQRDSIREAYHHAHIPAWGYDPAVVFVNWLYANSTNETIEIESAKDERVDIAIFMKYQIVESIINLLIKDDPYNSDPHEWSEGEHRYFLTTHALRWLPERTRFVNETDNEIAKRVIENYIGTDDLGQLKQDDALLIEALFDWLDKESI